MTDHDLKALSRTGPVHFVGAGGAGMCALAELLLRQGGKASGCDLKDGVALRHLEAMGAVVHIGHDPAHVEGAVAVVTTAAVPEDHPELARARVEGIPVLKRAEALGSLVNRGKVVAIAGTHGKTTTTAMTTRVLEVAGMEPTGFVGGRVAEWGGNLRVGSDELFVVEADEYDRSFLTLEPDVAVVTNLEADHLDVYGDLRGVRDGFRTFLSALRRGGRAAVCADDPGAAQLLPALGERGYSYGLSAGSRLRAVNVLVRPRLTRLRVMEDGRDRGVLELSLGGLHNLRNALGAAAAARALGVEWKDITDGLSCFRGVARRFERLGSVRGVDVVDDYAHHPTEVWATVEAARASFPDGHLVVAFQPHLYTRTRDFHREFGAALAGADVVWVTDVFPAREAPIPGVSGELVADAARDAGAQVIYHRTVDDLPGALADHLRAGDVLITMGAGSIETVGPEVMRELEARVHA